MKLNEIYTFLYFVFFISILYPTGLFEIIILEKNVFTKIGKDLSFK